MGELNNLDTNSVDFIAERHKQSDRGRGRSIPDDNFSDLGFGPQHHGGGSLDASDSTVDTTGTPVVEEKIEDATSSQAKMMAKFMAGGFGETTKAEDDAIAAKKNELMVPVETVPEVIPVEEEIISPAPQEPEPQPVADVPIIQSEPIKAPSTETSQTEVKASQKAIQSQLFEARKRNSERDVALLLGLAVQKGYLGVDDEGKAVAETPSNEGLLKAAGKFKNRRVIFAAPAPSEPQATVGSTDETNIKEQTGERSKAVGWAEINGLSNARAEEAAVGEPTNEPEKEIAEEIEPSQVGDGVISDAPERKDPLESVAEEAPEISTESDQNVEELPFEEVGSQAETVEQRARKNQSFQELEKRITRAETIQTPPQKGILSIAYLWATGRRDELRDYRDKKEAFYKAQHELKELNKRRDGWLKKETDILVDASKTETMLSQVVTKIAEGNSTKKDEARLQKMIAGLVSQREALDGIYAHEVATFLGIPPKDIIQKEWGGIDRFSEDMLALQIDAKKQAIDILKSELLPSSNEATAPDLKSARFEKWLSNLNVGVEGQATLRDLGPEAQGKFFKEEANASILEIANARALVSVLESELQAKTNDGFIATNPTEMFQLVAALRVAKLAEKQAEAGVRLALQRVSKSEAFSSLTTQILGSLKKEVGGRVFAVDSGLEITAETRLSELVLNGNSDLAVDIKTYWQGINIAKQAGQKVGSWAVGLRAGFNKKFSELIPESTKAAQKAATLSALVAEIESGRSETVETINAIQEISKMAQGRREAIALGAIVGADKMTSAERKDATDSIVEGLIGVLNISSTNKNKLKESYVINGVDGEKGEIFLADLLEYYQRSKLNFERRKKKAEKELKEEIERRKFLEDIYQKTLNSEIFIMPLEDIERELDELDQQINQRVLRTQEKMDHSVAVFDRKLRALQYQFDKEKYQSVLRKIA